MTGLGPVTHDFLRRAKPGHDEWANPSRAPLDLMPMRLVGAMMGVEWPYANGGW